MAKAQLLERVEGLGDIYLVEAPFDKQLRAFNKTGIKYPISVRDAAYVRLNGVNKRWTTTCHAPILARDSPVIVARISPLVENLKMAIQATLQSHRYKKYPVFDRNIYVQWYDLAEKEKKKKPENRAAIFLDERGDHKIHRDSEQARFLFQDTRKRYFDRFVDLGNEIESWQINPKIVDAQMGTIINCLNFGGVIDGSSLLSFRGYLDNSDIVEALGVLSEKTGKVSSSYARPYKK